VTSPRMPVSLLGSRKEVEENLEGKILQKFQSAKVFKA